MLKIIDKIAWVKDNDEYLLANYETGKVSIIKGTGTDILDCIISGMDDSSIVTTLAAKYNMPECDISNDIHSFIDDLLARSYLIRE